MDFDFSDDQQQLRDAARRWVDKAYTFEHRRAAVAAGGFRREAWDALAELGLTALNVPEAHGGLGLGAVDAMVVMEEMGRGMVQEPLAQSFITAKVLAQYAPAAVQADWLPRVAAGEALVVLAHQERRARYHLEKCESKATLTPDGYALTAHKSIVPAGDQADAFLVPAVLASVLQIGPEAVELVDRTMIDLEARSVLHRDRGRLARAVQLGRGVVLDGLGRVVDVLVARAESDSEAGLARLVAEVDAQTTIRTP